MKNIKPKKKNLVWLSYCDENPEKFNGVLIMESKEFMAACANARIMNLSPGGQVFGYPISPEVVHLIKDKDIHRLLNAKEAQALVDMLDEHMGL